ncbi:thiamine pyrophosphate-binding protein [Aureimonas fodinaquatilis]|uniref:Thiamine pyrophosphate-binding protein n=1 Tax=Aureimonas fodinaquatilis TaxID=2565783 RepID=A0A5B0DUT6_9HYPH|nr:thiamine pyrophosphate-binding protein [Aureimonas fodinaquatilis]KAA0969340.1 thiamine pyrophosphate-binding protein [Aureimonas fodinaquatilis]
MNCSDVMVRYLAAANTRFVFGYPGDPSVPFLEACRLHGTEFVLGTREGTAGLMAEAYGQITDQPGVVLSTLGPGSSNLVNAVANAWCDRAPMIAISGQIESRREPYFTHQVIDHNQVFTPISKWTTSILPTTVSTIMRKAYRVSMADRPGPVHISTPGDVVGAEATDDAIIMPPLQAISHGLNVYGTVRDPAKTVANARRPIILAGLSAVRGKAGAAIARLAEKLGCPVVVSPMAKGIIDETHPYYAGTLDMACNAFVWDFLKSSDLLLNVGFDAVELIKPWTVQTPTIHIDSVANTDQIYSAEIEIVGDISTAVDALTDAIHDSGARWSECELASHRTALRALYSAGRVSGRLNPTDLVDIVLAASPHDTVATTDVGSHKLLVGQGWVSRLPKTMLMSNGLSSMGYSLPAAIVAKLLMPERNVVCFTGDGGLAMVQGELRTASHLNLGITVVVFCDNSLNRIELKQNARQFPSFGTTIPETDIVMLARAMACDAVRVDTAAELEKAMSDGPASDRPLIIAAHIDPSQYMAQF